jgi:Flp pilus assembly protein TadG
LDTTFSFVAECAEPKMFATFMRSRLSSIFPRKRRFRRNEDGSTAVEFALVIVPFLACMFAIIEIGLVFLAGQVLETSVGDASRMILTGQAQAGQFDATAFKNQICTNGVRAMFTCDNIKIDVRTAASFAAGNFAPPVNAQKVLDTSGFGYSPGQPCDIVIVRVAYEWPTFVRMLGLDLATLANGKHLLMSTMAFRNEPYSGTGFC